MTLEALTPRAISCLVKHMTDTVVSMPRSAITLVPQPSVDVTQFPAPTGREHEDRPEDG
jgi:hypothetical protein